MAWGLPLQEEKPGHGTAFTELPRHEVERQHRGCQTAQRQHHHLDDVGVADDLHAPHGDHDREKREEHHAGHEGHPGEIFHGQGAEIEDAREVDEDVHQEPKDRHDRRHELSVTLL